MSCNNANMIITAMLMEPTSPAKHIAFLRKLKYPKMRTLAAAKTR